MTVPTYVPVPVPARHVPDVLRFVLELGQSGPEDGHTQPSQRDDPDGGSPAAGWTENVVIRMLRESNRLPHDAMAIIARAGDDGISTDELAERLNYDHGAQSVAGMLGALTKRCKSRYELDEPYTRRWPDPDNGEPDTLLFVPEPVRTWIIRNTDDPSA